MKIGKFVRVILGKDTMRVCIFIEDLCISSESVSIRVSLCYKRIPKDC